MGKPEDIPQDVLRLAQATQDAAEAECKAQRYVYGFGTGNAKTVLDLHIARAIMAAKEEARNDALDEAAQVCRARVSLFTSYGSGLAGRNALKEAASSILAIRSTKEPK